MIRIVNLQVDRLIHVLGVELFVEVSGDETLVGGASLAKALRWIGDLWIYGAHDAARRLAWGALGPVCLSMHESTAVAQ
jgi:hypothetical protein